MKSSMFRCFVAIVPLFSLLYACGSDSDPFDAPQIDRQVAASNATSSGEIAVGQWLKFMTTSEDGSRTVVRVEVTGEEDGYFWFKSHSDSDDAGSADLKFLAKPPTIDNPQGYVEEIEGGDFDTGNDWADEYLNDFFNAQLAEELVNSMIQIDYTELELSADAITVPAGTFDGCYERIESAENYENTETTVWRHPAVPITGMVRTEANNGSFVTELLDFGQN